MPVIVEARANMFQSLRDALREIVPIAEFQAFRRPLWRLFSLPETPLAKWKEMETFGMIATVLTPNLIEEVSQWRSVKAIYQDRVMYAIGQASTSWFTTPLNEYRTLELDQADLEGYRGSGVKVAVIDTGTRLTHESFIGAKLKILTAMPEKGGAGLDTSGHGTFVSSTIIGRRLYVHQYNANVGGVAPEAEVVSIQALGFVVGAGFESDTLQALEMSLKEGCHIVNMSLGAKDPPPDEFNPSAKAISQLSEKGMVIVCAAGNNGPDEGTINSPGSARDAFTVGAFSSYDGTVPDFSCRGPSPNGEVKPDVVAPGVNILSACVGVLDTLEDPKVRGYAILSGTSMACPMAAGLLARVKQLFDVNGIPFNIYTVKEACSLSGGVKDNEKGWGFIRWSWFKEYVETKR